MEWTAFSPDKSDRACVGRTRTPTCICATPHNTLQELRRAINFEYTLLPQTFLDNLIHNMKNRIKAYILIRGGHILYYFFPVWL